MPRHQSGVALLEVVLAITLLSVGILALLRTIPAAQWLEASSARRSRAVLAATGRLERIRAELGVSGCPVSQAGSATDSAPPPVHVVWRVAPAGAVARVVVEASVAFGRGILTDTLVGVVRCS